MQLSIIEILFVVVLALLVLGPEQFVRRSQDLGRFWGRFKTQMNNYRVMASEEMQKTSQGIKGSQDDAEK